MLMISSPMRAQIAPPPDWSPQLADAFSTYYEGDLARAQKLAEQVVQQSGDPAIKREARAMMAIFMLRSQSRQDRLDGRARLSQLSADDAELVERPECLLALGMAQRELTETAASIDSLQLALDQFKRQGRSPRALAAAVELARTWAVHTEWARGIMGASFPKPTTVAEADETRWRQIDSVRELIAGLPGAAEAQGEIDVVAAGVALRLSDRAAAARDQLRRLAGNAPTATLAASAALLLAEQQERLGAFADAIALYRQAADNGEPRCADAARSSVTRLVEPQIELLAPQSSGESASFDVSLRARNLDAVQIELRRLDLANWVTRTRGKLPEAELPLEGAVVATRDVVTTIAPAHAWWSSAAEPIRFQAAAGAYVLVARGKQGSLAERVERRLLVVGGPELHVFCGPSRVLAVAMREGKPLSAPAILKFWVEGYTEPAELKLENGFVSAPLPAAVRAMRQPRWTALLEFEGQLALCRGTAPGEAVDQEVVPTALAIGAPREVPVGGEWLVTGVLIWPGAQSPPLKPQQLAIDLVDVADRVVWTGKATTDAAGGFQARATIPAPAAGQSLRCQIKVDGQVLPLQFARPMVRVLALDEQPVATRFDGPTLFNEARPMLPLQLSATTAWGQPLPSIVTFMRTFMVRLPGGDPPSEFAAAKSQFRGMRLDPAGQRQMYLPLKDFDLPAGLPVAAWQVFTLLAPDGRRTVRTRGALFSEDPTPMWLNVLPTAPIAHQPFSVSAGWFDPSGALQGARPTITILKGGTPLDQLACAPIGGALRTQGWIAPQPGEYELEAAMARSDGSVARARRKFVVAEPLDHVGTPIESVELSRGGDRKTLQVRVNGRSERPLLALALSGDPVAATWIAPFEHASQTAIALDRVPRDRVQVVLLDFRGGEPVAVMQSIESSASASAVAIEDVSVGSVNTAYHARFEPAITGAEATLLLRVSAAEDVGTVDWTGRESGELAPFDEMVMPTASSCSRREIGGAAGGSGIVLAHAIDPAVAAALLRQQTVWTERRTANAPAESAQAVSFDGSFPTPAEPGTYLLTAVLHSPRGGWWLDQRKFRVDRPQRVSLFAPFSWQLGDRIAMQARVTNDASVEVSGEWKVTAGLGLSLDRCEVAVGGGALKIDGGTTTLTLQPRSSATINIFVEASKVTRGLAQAEWRIGGESARANAGYRVFDAGASAGTPATAPARPRVRVSRSFYRAVMKIPDLDDAWGKPRETTIDAAERYLLEPGATVPVGSLILVDEVFENTASLTDVEWTQRAASNCVTWGGAADQMRVLGASPERRRDSVRYALPALATGRYSHQYAWVATRPGASRLPAPEIRVGRDSIQVEVSPDAATLTVQP